MTKAVRKYAIGFKTQEGKYKRIGVVTAPSFKDATWSLLWGHPFFDLEKATLGGNQLIELPIVE